MVDGLLYQFDKIAKIVTVLMLNEKTGTVKE